MRNALVFAILLCASCKSREMKRLMESKEDVAKAQTEKLAYEAYPQWAAAHPDKQCPDNIEQLLEYVDSKSTKDPWGQSYKMLCGPGAPAGVRGLGVVSFGPDTKEGTDDDLKSW